MSRELNNRTYKVGPFTCFAISDPKLREVWAADFRDRITHHLLVSYLEPLWEKIFIHDSYACRLKKGAHKAADKIKKILAREKNLWYLHLDIRGFFTGIDKNILFGIISKRVKNPELIYLAKLIIFHDPRSDYLVKGSEKLLRTVPPHKSLFGSPGGKGLPIGNYTSQFFANVYLNELDQYAKRILKCRYYFRYMDDILILDKDRGLLRLLAQKINAFLIKNLKLELHPKKTILQNAAKGLDFLGYIIYPHYCLSRKRVVGNIKAKLKYFNKLLSACRPPHSLCHSRAGGNPCPLSCFGITAGACPRLRSGAVTENKEIIVKKAQATINSYWGHFKHANCASLKIKLYDNHFGELKKYLEPLKNHGHFVIKKKCFPANLYR